MVKELDEFVIEEVLDMFDDVIKFYGEDFYYTSRAFNIDNIYYCDLVSYEDILYFGVWKLVEKQGTLFKIRGLFKKLLKENGVVAIWRYADDKRMAGIFKRILNRYENVYEISRDGIEMLIIKSE